MCYPARMHTMTPRRRFAASSLPVLALLVWAAGPAAAAPQGAQVIQAAPIAAGGTASAELSRFAPRPSRATRLDFELWDIALKEFVSYGGPSLRRRAPRPAPMTGSRLILGHTSPYRLEGNKVLFEGMKREFEGSLEAYVQDLIDIGNRIDIPALPRDEQLSYWLNLHNAVVVREIAKRYPIEYPDRIKGPDGLSLHDSKLMTIDGVALSLRDIREGIVYPNWRDPRVIYGFFHGELGGPSLQRAAFEGPTVWDTLNVSSREFASSLRGVEKVGNRLLVSRIYREAAPFFFPDFDADLRAHLIAAGSDESVADIRAVAAPVEIGDYARVIADLTGGDGNRRPASAVTSFSRNGGRIDNSAIGRAVREQREKYEEIRRRGLNSVVTIEDIETDPSQSDYIDPNADD